jgi:hypothetical protein
MKNYVINDGAFTKAGNFSGYTALGERVHIYKRQMDSLGWSSDNDVEFPFYSIAKLKDIEELDADGKPTGVIVDQRLTALSVFKTRDAIKHAHSEASLLDIEIAQEVAKKASEAGLTQSAIDQLLSVGV